MLDFNGKVAVITGGASGVGRALGDRLVREGARVVLRIGVGPVSVDWTAVHRDFVAGRSFVDEQAGGPFASLTASRWPYRWRR